MQKNKNFSFLASSCISENIKVGKEESADVNPVDVEKISPVKKVRHRTFCFYDTTTSLLLGNIFNTANKNILAYNSFLHPLNKSRYCALSFSQEHFGARYGIYGKQLKYFGFVFVCLVFVCYYFNELNPFSID